MLRIGRPSTFDLFYIKLQSAVRISWHEFQRTAELGQNIPSASLEVEDTCSSCLIGKRSRKKITCEQAAERIMLQPHQLCPCRESSLDEPRSNNGTDRAVFQGANGG